MTHPNSLLIISHDIVDAQMAGPGIRYYHLARVLGRDLAVTLAVPGQPPAGLAMAGFAVATYAPQQWASLAPLVAQAQICLLPGDLAAHFPQLAQAEAALVIDGYDPVLAEWLAIHAHLPLGDLHGPWQARYQAYQAQFALGDFFICASERQRDWWLGILEANGRINPATHRADPALRRLIDVVPYGLPATPPMPTRSVIKGVWPGITPSDKLVVWGGGLWPWLDPQTAVRALARIATQRADVKLIFPGTRHPNPSMAAMPSAVAATQQLADDLGLTNRSVFFGDWVAYADWPNVLLESNIALTLHFDTLETRLAFRSRVLEYIWAELPIVATGGDATSDLIAAYGLGQIVAAEDDTAVADAILALLDRPPAATHYTQARADLTWERAAVPLLAFCQQPMRAPDRTYWLLRDARTAALEAEVAYWRGLAQRYEQGRFIRTMRQLDQLKRRFLP